jgi:hypothetical protein
MERGDKRWVMWTHVKKKDGRVEEEPLGGRLMRYHDPAPEAAVNPDYPLQDYPNH